MKKLAIIGTGIAGMASAHFLKDRYDLTIYEKNEYIGGHTNTVSVDEDGMPVWMDTGFMVYNEPTYPELTALFHSLNVPTQPTSMSFSVQHLSSGWEYCGSGLNGLFSQRQQLLNPRFYRFLYQIHRFNEESIALLDEPNAETLTVAEFVKQKKLGDDFLHRYLIPMSSAVWSTPPDLMLQFPAVTLIRFFKNHGFLGLNTQLPWRTIRGGSRQYRDKLIAAFRDRIQVGNGVVRVMRASSGVDLTDSRGKTEHFDCVLIAAHANETLAMLGSPTALEQKLLSVFHYQPNKAMIHTDETVMPESRRAWSSWNYRLGEKHPSTIYWMNSLQGVSEKKNYFVSINDQGWVNPKKILWERLYEHPLFDVAAIQAQKKLPELNQSGPIYYCGSYFRYGFHEDALLSAVQVCRSLQG